MQFFQALKITPLPSTNILSRLVLFLALMLAFTVSPPTTVFGSGRGADASPRLVQLKLQFNF